MNTACYLLSSQNIGKSLYMFLFITYLRIMELLLFGYLQFSTCVPTSIRSSPIGVEFLVRSVVKRTGLVYLLLSVCEYIMMLLLLVSINTLEQLISDC